MASEKLSELRETVDLAREGKLSQALQIVRSGKGKEFMDQARGRMRILLVEDHNDSATVMARVLSHLGHQVDIAGTVTAAVDLFQNEQYDLDRLSRPYGAGPRARES